MVDMSIRSLTTQEMRAAEAYDTWLYESNHRFGGYHREAFLAGFMAACSVDVCEDSTQEQAGHGLP